jgi:acyl transferase domain-containing protein
MVSDADKFDASFWGFQPYEAELMDPQQRLFLQVAYHALEDAGHAFAKPPPPPLLPLLPRNTTTTTTTTTAVSSSSSSASSSPSTSTSTSTLAAGAARHNPRTMRRLKQRTGVFAACGIDGYLIHHLEGGGLKTPLEPAKTWTTEVGNEKDYISTRVSHQLNLGGPSFTINSACSSGLVAVAQAAAAIRSGQCDAAVAGAASLTFPNFGYLYQDGLPASRDGTVRPFDDQASGTIFGDSVGAVVLKRLDHALRDGDRVYAEVRHGGACWRGRGGGVGGQGVEDEDLVW